QVVSCFQTSSSASSLKMRTRIGECFGIFFCRSSESSSGGNSFVALGGNGLLSSPRHVTGVNAAAKAAVSTSARTTVARIIARPPDVDPVLSECLSSVAFVGQTQTRVPQMMPGCANKRSQAARCPAAHERPLLLRCTARACWLALSTTRKMRHLAVSIVLGAKVGEREVALHAGQGLSATQLACNHDRGDGGRDRVRGACDASPHAPTPDRHADRGRGQQLLRGRSTLPCCARA